MRDRLEPCPFCGTKAHIEKGRLRTHKNRLKKEKKGYLAYTIGCSDPECILYSDGKTSRLFFSASRDGLPAMIRRWNRRKVYGDID